MHAMTLNNCFLENTIEFIDWKNIINSLQSTSGVVINDDPVKWNLKNTEYLKIRNKWQESNFNKHAIGWINYYPKTHFDNNIVTEISKFLKINIHRAWISKVEPGFYAPWHWDIDDKEDEYLSFGNILRFSIFINESEPGQIFILGKDYFYNSFAGLTIKWHSYQEWHCGINASFSPKYMMHLVGYE